jgi:predicted protein tyrosine phosphatase
MIFPLLPIVRDKLKKSFFQLNFPPMISDHEDIVTMEEVVENLFVSDIRGAMDKNLKEKNKITHILSCCDVDSFENVEQLRIPVVDVEIENFTKHFEKCSNFIKEGREKGNVLVHCNAGQSRCATAICA